MTAYYNEFDPYAAQWLRNLIAAGLIAPGVVDDRSITEVSPSDLAGFTQCHFFAGLGGWSRALRLGGWADDRPVWTGSCPCQPFSVAGKQAGFDDPRHLWPQFRRLIAERRPATVFGEQVAGASDWLGIVRGDLEALDYAVGAMPIEAASADAEHKRDRYWFVADHDGEQPSERLQRSGQFRRPGGDTESDAGPVAYSNRDPAGARPGDDGKVRGLQEGERESEQRPAVSGRGGEGGSLRNVAHRNSQRSQITLSQQGDAGTQLAPIARGGLCAVVNGDDAQRGADGARGHYAVGNAAGREQSPGHIAEPSDWGPGWTERELRDAGFTAAVANIAGRQYIECPDGKWRGLPPPGVRWLGNGIPARIPKLRALGNAIDPRPAAKFIQAYIEVKAA